MAFIRNDLLKSKLAVPVGNFYYFSAKPLLYRWKNDLFQVFLDNKWLNAESIDWDFQ